MPQNGIARRRDGPNFATLQQQPPNLQAKPWFLGAPITKVLCMFWAAGSLWVINNHSDDFNTIDAENNYGKNLWLATVWSGPSNWFFQSGTELLIGLSFLAHFLRRLEQELSSRRLVAWLLVSEVISTLVRLFALATLDEDISVTLVLTSAKGPYLFVGGVLCWYHVYVPRLYPRFLSSTTLGISCSEKTFPYLWALYVLSLRGTASFLMGVIGILASAMYFFLLFLSTKNTTANGNNNNNNNNINSITNLSFVDLPDAVVNLLPWDSLGGFFLVDSDPKVYAPYITRAAMNPGRPRRQRVPMAAVAAAAAPVDTPIAVAVPLPPPEAVAQLTSMGFEEDRVKEALQVSDNNVERAANLLLTRS